MKACTLCSGCLLIVLKEIPFTVASNKVILFRTLAITILLIIIVNIPACPDFWIKTLEVGSVVQCVVFQRERMDVQEFTI